MPPNTPHIPVLKNEVLAWLHPTPGRTYADLTLGAAGHSMAIAESLSGQSSLTSTLFGLDQDAQILRIAESNLKEFTATNDSLNIVLGQTNFEHAATWLAQHEALPLTGGFLADLGVSSLQLDDGTRGFSWRVEAPLDMRMNPNNSQTPPVSELVNTSTEDHLIEIFTNYGEARLSKSIAKAIVTARKQAAINTTTQLADLVVATYQHNIPNFRLANSRIHPATQIFQALRIAVNRELGVLDKLLHQLPELLAPGARAVFISFHSLEDRMVKRAFQYYRKADQLKVLTPKPVTASTQELKNNPRSRSAKLRAAEWL